MNTENAKFYDVDTKELIERMTQWRLDYVDSINNIRREGTLYDQRIVAEIIQGQINDIQILIQWCEILAHKVSELESPTKTDKHD